MQKEQNVRLVLASASPRRRELLSQIGLEFTVMPSTKEENAKTTEAGALVQELSRQKAVDIWEQLSGGQWQNPDTDQEQISEETQEPNLNGKRQPELLVIGADTVVCCEGKILGKPHDREAAVEMLTLYDKPLLNESCSDLLFPGCILLNCSRSHFNAFPVHTFPAAAVK